MLGGSGGQRDNSITRNDKHQTKSWVGGLAQILRVAAKRLHLLQSLVAVVRFSKRHQFVVGTVNHRYCVSDIQKKYSRTLRHAALGVIAPQVRDHGRDHLLKRPAVCQRIGKGLPTVCFKCSGHSLRGHVHCANKNSKHKVLWYEKLAWPIAATVHQSSCWGSQVPSPGTPRLALLWGPNCVD